MPKAAWAKGSRLLSTSCGAWPEVEGSSAASRGAWPTLLPLSDVYPVETDAADPEGAAEMKEKMQTPLDYLENLLSDGRPLMLGDRVSIADCTLQASLQFVRYVEADVIGDRPLLRAWDERYRARPAAQAVLRW